MSRIRLVSRRACRPDRRGRVALVVVALILVVLAAWLAFRSPARPGGATAVDPTGDVQAPHAPAAGKVVDEGAAARATAVPGQAPPATSDSRPAKPSRRTANATIRLLDAGSPMRQGRIVLTPFGGTGIAADVDPATGEARFTEMPIHSYEIALEQIPEGWLVSRATVRGERDDRGGREIAVKFGENRLDLELEAGAVVSGVVFDEKGWPEQDATVRISSLEGRDRYVPSRDVPVKDGGFRACVHAGLSAIEVMSAGGRVPPPPQRVQLAVGGRADLEFYFQAGTEQLVGRIVDETGAPFANLSVGLTRTTLVPPSPGSTAPPQEFRQGLQSAKSDADGRFVFEHLPRGRCIVNVEMEGYSPFGGPGQSIVGRAQEARTVELPRTEPDPWTIVVERAHPVLVRGKVLAKKQGEIASIDVVLPAGERRQQERRQDFRVEADGSFQFHVDRAETGAAIELKRDGRVSRVPLPVTPGSTEIVVEVPLP